MADGYAMTPDVPLTADELNERHQYGRSLYHEWRAHAEEQALVWKGDFDTRNLRTDAFYPRPSEGRALLKKLDEMLAIRSKKKISVQPSEGSEDTDQEQRRVEKLDTALYDWLRRHRKATHQDFMRMAARMTAVFGRGPMHTLYVPEYNAPPHTQVRVYDPRTTYPVRGQRGTAWVTREVVMTNYELRDYFEGLPEGYKKNLRMSLDASTLNGQYTMVEYWDDTHCAWSVGRTLVDAYEHGYGGLTYREMRLNEMPLDDERWASEGFLGPVMDAIKAKAIMRSRLITANETSYFHDLYVINQQGSLFKVDHNMKPGEPKEIGPGFQFQTVQKSVSHDLWQMLYQAFTGEINENTLSKLAFALDLPNVSGFATSQVLTIIQDSIADIRDQMEQSLGLVMGDVLRLHEVFAPPEGWKYSTGDKAGGRLKAADIAGHYDVEVKIKPALPQDRLQKITQLSQLIRPDPATGLPLMDLTSAMEITELIDDVEDPTAMQARTELEWLKLKDQGTADTYNQYLAAKHRKTTREWERVIAREDRRETKRDQRAAEQDIADGLSQDVVIPASLTTEQLHQVAMLEEQGQTRAAAVQMVMAGGLPRGAPGQSTLPTGAPAVNAAPGTSPELMDLLQQAGFPLQAPASPDGLTGYDNGMAPSVAPAAMQGAQPRQVVDQPALEVENLEELMRRGALPPPR